MYELALCGVGSVFWGSLTAQALYMLDHGNRRLGLRMRVCWGASASECEFIDVFVF
jgi:hypothetical protein